MCSIIAVCCGFWEYNTGSKFRIYLPKGTVYKGRQWCKLGVTSGQKPDRRRAEIEMGSIRVFKKSNRTEKS